MTTMNIKRTRSDKGLIKPDRSKTEENIRLILIDECDRHILDGGKWYLRPKKYLYGRMNNDPTRKLVFLHRLIMNPPPGLFVDHINGDKLDNRRQNLRVVNKSQNQMNITKYKNKTSIYKGVHAHKQHADKYGVFWVAKYKRDSKNRSIGFFKSEVEAAMAYDIYARLIFGEYARLNFPHSWERNALE